MEFHANGQQGEKYGFLQRGHHLTKHSFKWTEMPQALARFFLEYLNAGLNGRRFDFRRVPQTDSLADAVSKNNSKLYTLFVEALPKGGTAERVDRIFDGDNLHGRNPSERSVCVKTDYLPPACVELFWEDRPLTKPKEVEAFTRLFLAAWEMPPLAEPELPEAPGSPAPEPPPEPAKSTQPPEPARQQTPEPAGELFPTPPKEPAPGPTTAKPQSAQKPEPVQPTPEEPDYYGSPFKSKTLLFGKIPPKVPGDSEESTELPEPMRLKPEPPAEAVLKEFTSPLEPDYPKARKPLLRQIDRRLFEIQNPSGYKWGDSELLINFGNDESDKDVWRIRDACEGVAVFGSVGSGKTSGSGAAIARAYLRAGFGALVLTVKPDEARRWERLCKQTGRECDFIHVTPTSGHKLNFLQYELQRPGERFAVAEDLITLFRTLIGVMSRSKRADIGDDFWTNATNQLLRKLTELFLLAKEPLTLEHMVRFINKAPKNTRNDWHTVEFFSDVIQQAEENAQKGSPEDQRIYQECREYWTEAYPAVADVTRSGFITAFSAMADVLSGRGIHEMIGTETNLTPEMILSGKVVVLDIPLKGNIQGGLMVQSMWKLLFQQAAERRADKGQPTARPACLWEDEGHMFFSQHDVDFQPTARDVRAPHVIISQNLHNFLQQGHNPHAVEAVFAAMNTLLFHTNGDMMTNRWASEKIGVIRKLKLTTDGLLRTMTDKDYTFAERRPEEVKNVGKMKVVEERKPGLPPEDFAKLKRGGDGTCEAVLIWLSHQFAANGGRNFCVLTFNQEPKEPT